MPGADDPDRLATFGEHYRQQSTGGGVPEQGETLLSFGVPRISNDAAQWISEGRGGFFERYPMFVARLRVALR